MEHRMGKIVRVTLDEERCLHHGCCVEVCPSVFEWHPTSPNATVRKDASRHTLAQEKAIREAVVACPVNVIAIEEK